MIVDTRIFHWTKIRPLLCERRLWLATRFGTFLCRPCTTTTWNFRMQRLMAEVNTWRIIFPSLSLNLVAVPRNSTPGKFANIWHFEQVGTKFDKKKPCIFFFDSDVFAAVAVVEVVAKARYFLWHLNKTDSALKRIPRVGPCRPSVLFFDSLQSSQLPRTDTQCQPVPNESISMSFCTRKASTVGLPFVIIG